MSRIYAGDVNSIDQEVLDSLKSLSDEYRVYASFQVGREVDFLIARAEPGGHSALILTELKRYNRCISGRGQDSEWEMESEDGSWTPIDSTRDRNPYFQAVNTVNAVNDWLENNQRRFLIDRPGILGRDEFRCWPDLLVLSPPGVIHSLPLRPTSRFGAWFFDLDRWLRSVIAWKPTLGVGLTVGELDRLGEALGLSVIWDSSGTTEMESPAAPAESSDVEPFVGWVRGLLQRIDDLEARVRALEGRPHANGAVLRLLPQRRTDPALTDEEKDALLNAVAEVAREGKVRAAPTVLGRMEVFLGYSLKERQYNGFGNATRLLEQAQSEGVIKFGRRRGPNHTVYLPEETFEAEDVPVEA